MMPFLRAESRTKDHHFLAATRAAWVLMFAVLTVSVEAAVVPSETPLNQKEFRHPSLHIPNLERPLAELGPAVAGRGLDLLSLGAGPGSGFFDWRGARWGSLILSHPLIPGDGKGNTLGTDRVGNAEIWKAVSDYVARHGRELRRRPLRAGQPHASGSSPTATSSRSTLSAWWAGSPSATAA